MYTIFSRGVADAIGLDLQSTQDMITDSSFTINMLMIASPLGLFIPFYIMFTRNFFVGLILLGIVTVAPKIIARIFYHPKFFATRSIKNFNKYRNLHYNKFKRKKEDVEVFNQLQNLLEELAYKSYS